MGQEINKNQEKRKMPVKQGKNKMEAPSAMLT